MLPSQRTSKGQTRKLSHRGQTSYPNKPNAQQYHNTAETQSPFPITDPRAKQQSTVPPTKDKFTWLPSYARILPSPQNTHSRHRVPRKYLPTPSRQTRPTTGPNTARPAIPKLPIQQPSHPRKT
ncbi:hypothetical protein IQ07DRAFT_590611 [Pyrenochaeta sp. DS3sAY3a]|nr:hypothetical protein IQ07DRAFT_590611 [Pyrenochaeta sp. DS3sAY3a]